jgi:hypothetical protein
MRRILEEAYSLRPAWVGAGTTVALEYINNLIGIITLVYLIQQIIK